MIYQIVLAGLIYVSSANRLLLQSSAVDCCYNGAACSDFSGVARVCSYNICTVGCTTLGDTDTMCGLVQNEINIPVTCQDDGAQYVCLPPTAPADVCNTPPATDAPVTGTTAVATVDPAATTADGTVTAPSVPAFDLSCTTVADCEAINSQITGYVGYVGEAFRCIQGECTITCTTATNCGTAAGLINDNFGTAYDFVCDGSSDPVCVHRSSLPTTTAGPDATEAATTEDADGCNADVCSAQRSECNEEGPAGACYVQFELDADICIFNRGKKRKQVYNNFRVAISTAINAEFTLDGVCDNSTVVVTGYACLEKAHPMYVFDTRPTKDTCPANAATRCVKGNQGNFAVSVGVKLALFCGSGSCADLQEISDRLRSLVGWAANYVEGVEELSVNDDTLCGEGFGFVTANDLVIRVYNADGSLYDTILDTTGGAVRGWWCMAGVVAVVMLAFL